MSEPMIHLEGVHKHYGKVHALRGLTFSVQPGEIFGFLGPNGAGKTTTIRCMLDIIRPDSGQIQVLGINPQQRPQQLKKLVGYLPGDLKMPGNFKVMQFLAYLCRIRGIDPVFSRINALAARLELDLNKKIKTLSQGNKQKVGLVQALMAQPSLLLLDEPTLGLDPLIKQEVLKIVREEKSRGASVFFSSHILSEVQETADRVGIIRKGRLVETAQTKDLLQRAITRATVHFKEPLADFKMDDLQNVEVLRFNHDNRSLTLEITGDMDAFIKMLAQYPVRQLEIHRPSLEEVFLKYYQREGEEG